MAGWVRFLADGLGAEGATLRFREEEPTTKKDKIGLFAKLTVI